MFSKMLVSTYESTQRQNPEEQQRHLHHHENLKSHITVYCFPGNKIGLITSVLMQTIHLS
jgi:hypothetical protein